MLAVYLLTSEVLLLTLRVSSQMSDVLLLMSEVSLTFAVLVLTSLMSCVLLLMSEALSLTSAVFLRTSLISIVLLPMSEVLSLTSTVVANVECFVAYVMDVVAGVEYVVAGVCGFCR